MHSMNIKITENKILLGYEKVSLGK